MEKIWQVELNSKFQPTRDQSLLACCATLLPVPDLNVHAYGRPLALCENQQWWEHENAVGAK